jgi:hypothetical protein
LKERSEKEGPADQLQEEEHLGLYARSPGKPKGILQQKKKVYCRDTSI